MKWVSVKWLSVRWVSVRWINTKPINRPVKERERGPVSSLVPRLVRPVASGGARGAMAPPGPSPGPPWPQSWPPLALALAPPGPTVGPPDLIPGPLGLGYPMKSDEIRRILPPLEFRNLIDYPPPRILPTTHESKSRKTSNPTNPTPPRICKLHRLPPPSNFTNHPQNLESYPPPPSK